MEWFLFKAFIMGIVEGITEFLPISSTGHMILVGHFINFVGKFHVLFDIVIQLGAVLAVIVLYRDKIFNSLKNLQPNQWGFKLWLKVLVAFVPSGIVGVLLHDYIESNLFNIFNVSVALIAGALFILWTENRNKIAMIDNIDSLALKKCLFIGMVQCLALFPGMSRSASTIIGGLLVGLTASAAAEFSFFLAIPTMFAATGYSLLKYSEAISYEQLLALAIGFITSFIVALAVVSKFIKFLGTHKLSVFAYYRLVLGIIMLIIIVGTKIL